MATLMTNIISLQPCYFVIFNTHANSEHKGPNGFGQCTTFSKLSSIFLLVIHLNVHDLYNFFHSKSSISRLK